MNKEGESMNEEEVILKWKEEDKKEAKNKEVDSMNEEEDNSKWEKEDKKGGNEQSSRKC